MQHAKHTNRPTKRTDVRLATAVAAGLVAISVLSVFAGRAEAQAVCGPRHDIERKLDKGFGEHPVSIGLAEGGNLIEVFAGKDGRTWTILATRPDGLSCLIANGESWQVLPIKVGGPGV